MNAKRLFSLTNVYYNDNIYNFLTAFGIGRVLINLPKCLRYIRFYSIFITG